MNVARARPNVRARQPTQPAAGLIPVVPILGGALGGVLGFAGLQTAIREFFGGGDGEGLPIEAVIALGVVLLIVVLAIAN